MCCWAKMQGGDAVQGAEQWARSPHVPSPEAGQEVVRVGMRAHAHRSVTSLCRTNQPSVLPGSED